MINIYRAFRTGLHDGLASPYDMSIGMSYRQPLRQSAWDRGSLIGQRIGRLRAAWPHTA